MMEVQRKNERTRLGALATRLGLTALLCLAVGSGTADAFPSYDDGVGNGCVQCHTGFQTGPGGPLHALHVSKFGITQCNFCHPNGQGSTPVLTYFSGPGGGFGCAGCHGNDYGEISPNSGQPKSTGYGLRAAHANAEVGFCSGCHAPGAFGSPMVLPPILPESVPPPYYLMAGNNNLHNPCFSQQEDLPGNGGPTDVEFVPDNLGLDNDGDGLRDWPADPDCAQPTTTTTTTTTTLPFECGPAPANGCIAVGKGQFAVSEKSAGKEKMKLSFNKLVPAVAASEFGNPTLPLSTSYLVCVYDDADVFVGDYLVARGGDFCDPKFCWAANKDKGYKYQDKLLAADGISKIQLGAGDAGKGKVKFNGKNKAPALNLPTGFTAALSGSTKATVQVLSSDAECFGMTLDDVKKNDPLNFSAKGEQ